MAGVSGLRAQFESPSLSPAGSPVVKRVAENGDKSDDVKRSKPKISKSVLADIGKSISHSSPTTADTKKRRLTKSKTVIEENKKNGVGKGDKQTDKAMAALAGVIKSSSNSPRGSKMSLTSFDGSSPFQNRNDRFSLSENFDTTLKLERSGEFNAETNNTNNLRYPFPKTESDTRKYKTLSTPFPPALIIQQPNDDDSKESSSSTLKSPTKPPLRPKPTTLPKKFSNKPRTAPKPAIAQKPKLKSPPNDDSNKDRKSLVVDQKDEEEQVIKKYLAEEKSQDSNKLSNDDKGTDMTDGADGNYPSNEHVLMCGGNDVAVLTDQISVQSETNVHPKASVQSQACVTPKLDVGGCKRSNADSGFQEEPYEEDKLKSKECDIVVSEWDAEKTEKNRTKRHKIAMELLETEIKYVDHLKIIAEDFRQCLLALNIKTNKPVIPDSTMNLIFLNIGEIYNLNTQLMSDLQKRMDEWDTMEQIGDVINSFAPFLKLYSMYTAGFEDSMKLLTRSMSKEKKLDATVKEFERKIGSGLGVAHYMLEPVQRIPRYKLLLTEYLKYLPQLSSERPTAEKALNIIAEAADKTNNRIKELENSNEILVIERSLTDYEGSLLQAHRRFIRKGILQKLSRKTQFPRMFFLFSDVLLHAEVTSPSTFKFKNEVPLCGMKLEVPKVSLVQHSFVVLGTTRSFILSASCEEEKDEWMISLYGAINDDREKRKSIKRDQYLMTVDRSEFGCSAPIMVRDINVSQCQQCSRDFTFTFRRHHCRACGRVVCSYCSPVKAYLSYSKKEERVCVICDLTRKQSFDEEVDCPVTSPLREQPVMCPNIPSILFVNPNEREEQVIMEGYVLEQNGNKFTKCWYMLDRNLALYKFRAHEDIRATATVPLPGYNILQDRKTLTISLVHPTSKKKIHNLKFKIESKEEFESWYDVIVKATRLEVAESVSRDHSPYKSPIHDSSPERKLRSQSMSDLLCDDDRGDLDRSI